MCSPTAGWNGWKWAGNSSLSLNFLHVKGPLILPHESVSNCTRHNSADSVPTSNLVCTMEVAIRTTLCIAGII